MNRPEVSGVLAKCSIALILAITILPACTKKKNTGASTVEAASASAAIDEQRRAVSINFTEEPKTLDPQRSTDVIASMLLGHTNEGLVRLDPSNKPFPAQAESWEIKSPTEYIFKIRPGALWSDGRQVTAHDFVHAWRRAVDPKVASEYGFMIYTVKNGRAINEGKQPVETLGAKAVDDMTLQVQLERPAAHFLRLLSFPTYFPAREDFVKKHGEAYAADADKLLYNGPFVISSWNHNASIKLVKNEHYWNKNEIWLNEINMPYLIRDMNSEFNMFKDGKFAMTWGITKELLPEAQKASMQIRRYNVGAIWYLEFNTTRPIFANKNFRKAIQYALNREEFTRQIEGIPGSKPIFGIIPEYMPGVNKRYGEEYPLTFKDGDVETARKYLEKAKQELGLKEFPPLTVLANDTDSIKRNLEYFQRYLKEKLGIDLKLDFQTFKVRLERVQRKDFDIVNTGWSPDYLDVMSFADLFTSWNQNNHTGWASKEYDDLIQKAMDSVDPKARLDFVYAAEKHLVEEAPLASIFQASRVYVQDPRLVGVLRRTVGPDPDFYYAKISRPPNAAK